MDQWLHKHKYKVHLTTFSMMIIASSGLYLAMDRDSTNLVWALLAIFVIANLATMSIK